MQYTDRAIRNHVYNEDRHTNLEILGPAETAGLDYNAQNLIFINESGLYALIFGSKKTEVK